MKLCLLLLQIVNSDSNLKFLQEERRMSSAKYQVHDETTQVSYNYLFNIWNWFVCLTGWVGFYVLCSQIQLFTLCSLLREVFSVWIPLFLCSPHKNENNLLKNMLAFYQLSFCSNYWMMDMFFILNCYFSGLHALPPTVVGVKRFK